MLHLHAVAELDCRCVEGQRALGLIVSKAVFSLPELEGQSF
jgi:hypothetical protein